MAEYGSLDGAVAAALVTNNVGAANPTIVGSVVAVYSNKGATTAVVEAVEVANRVGAPAIPPRW